MGNKNQKYPTILGVLIGTVMGFFITARIRTSILSGNIMSFTCSSEAIIGALRNQDVVISDNDGKNLVFVGVMTAEKFLETRAVAVYETWGQTLPGKLAFFSSETSKTEADIPLVRLKGVDDSYPPQKKSFLMLKYMHDHFLEKFEWFMRADDDVYIRGDKLEEFLKSINSSRPHFIGQAGMGTKKEQGLLSLEENENFCMGGPGMVLSRETLRRVVPHIKYCIRNLYSTHEDVEIGRCIRRFVGISCTWSYEMQTIFYHNSSGNEAFTGNLKQKEVHRAITLHPVKQHKYQYHVHNYMQSIQIQNLRQRILILMRDINDANKALNDNSSFFNEEMDLPRLGKRPSLTKSNPEVIPWEFFTRVLFSDTNTNPKRRIEDWSKAALNNVVTRIMELINKFSLQRGRVIEFREILYGYKRLVPSYGVDYILDMLLMYKRYRGRKLTTAVRRHSYLQQPFTELQIRQSAQDESANKTINFILPLLGRYETFHRFLDIFETVCLLDNERVDLLVVLYQTQDLQTQTAKIIDHYKSIQDKYPNYKLILQTAEGTFSRASALQLGASKFQDDNLLFFIDVDMSMDKEFLQRTRLNVIRGIQVYFPIVFSQYSPKTYSKDPKNNDQISDDSGYWRQFGFGIGAMYKSDFDAVGGFNTSIQGWGQEDVDLYEKIVKSNLTIFRAVDPGLIHIYHKIECDSKLSKEQMTMCVNSGDNSYASLNVLADYVYDNLMADNGTISL
uniref:Hexosyltransferase n=1 Tax=Strigamia maritima TaxID=126957 RepID=T1J359_STRMM